jgi:hypothetical protein
MSWTPGRRRLALQREHAEGVDRRVEAVFINVHEAAGGAGEGERTAAKLLKTKIQVGRGAPVNFLEQIVRVVKFRVAHRFQPVEFDFQRFAFGGRCGSGSGSLGGFDGGFTFAVGLSFDGGLCFPRADVRPTSGARFSFNGRSGGFQRVGVERETIGVIVFSLEPDRAADDDEQNDEGQAHNALHR